MVYLVDLGNLPIVNEVMGDFSMSPIRPALQSELRRYPKTLELKWKLSWLSRNRWSRSRILILTEDPISVLPRVGPKLASTLEKLNIFQVNDFCFTFLTRSRINPSYTDYFPG